MKSYVAELHGFEETVADMAMDLLNQEPVYVGEWQAQKVAGTPLSTTFEIQNAVLDWKIPATIPVLQEIVKPNLPWAEDHFKERVSGTPYNPPPSAAYWPFAVSGHSSHVDESKKFSHTYPERIWPKHAGEVVVGENLGIRFKYGDLADLLKLLAREPSTRQAYLPIWFPEDLDAAANHQQRVPCTLGYHFLLRGNQLHIFYPIRSCDFVRHFRDDVYMAARLCQWVIHRLRETESNRDDWNPGEGPMIWQEVQPGNLTMHMVSLHCFAGDVAKLRREYVS